MALELLSLKPKYSKASDIYAYAIILWEIATGKDPYSGADATTVLNEVNEVKKGERKELPKECSISYATLISSCWSQRAEDRLTATTILKHLKKISKRSKNMSI